MKQNKCLCITIDVEPDGGLLRLSKKGPAAFSGVTVGVAKRLHPTLVKYGAVPTYLVDWRVLCDQEAMDTLCSLPSEYEIGAHLHVEQIPASTPGDDLHVRPRAFSCYDVTDELEAATIRTLTQALERRTGNRPTSFRAGRFGADAATIRSLGGLGYEVDSSVTPGVSWAAKGGPDFRGAPRQPYWVDPADIASPGDSTILEVPVTTGSRKSALLPDHWFFYDWLRPTNTSAHRMIGLIDETIERHEGSNPVVLTMMFHSQELVGGASPYAWTERAAHKLLSRIEAVVAYCRAHEFEFLPLNDVYKIFAAKPTATEARV